MARVAVTMAAAVSELCDAASRRAVGRNGAAYSAFRVWGRVFRKGNTEGGSRSSLRAFKPLAAGDKPFKPRPAGDKPFKLKVKTGYPKRKAGEAK